MIYELVWFRRIMRVITSGPGGCFIVEKSVKEKSSLVSVVWFLDIFVETKIVFD